MYQCSECDRRYARSEHLKRHCETAHPVAGAERRFHCGLEGCDKVYNRHDVLLRHQRSHHPHLMGDDINGGNVVASSSSSSSPPTGSAQHRSGSPSHTPPPFKKHKSTSSRGSSLHPHPHPHSHPQPQPMQQTPHSAYLDPNQRPTSSMASHSSSVEEDFVDSARRRQRFLLNPSDPHLDVRAPQNVASSSGPVDTSTNANGNTDANANGYAFANANAYAHPLQQQSQQRAAPSNPSIPIEPSGTPIDLALPPYMTSAPNLLHAPPAFAPSGVPPLMPPATNSSAYLAIPNHQTHAGHRPPSNAGGGFGGTQTPTQGWSATSGDILADLGLGAHNIADYDFNFSPRGWDTIDGSLNHHNLVGLDWIMDEALETGSATDISTVGVGARFPISEDDHASTEFGNSPNARNGPRRRGAESDTSPNHTASLNLMNLANTAIDAATDPNDLRNGAAAATNAAMGGISRDEEDVSEWPQDYRPAKSKPTLIEISDYCLTIEDDVDLHDTATAAGGAFGHKNSANAGDSTQQEEQQHRLPFVLIDEGLDQTKDPSTKGSSASFEQLRGFNKWHISEHSRKQLLTYLQQCCRHPWSLYSFENPSDTFLTCTQMETLIALFFRKYHPYVPVLHPPTFDVTQAPPVLSLVMLAVGLVFYAAEVQSCVPNLKKKSLARLRRSTSVLSLAFSETVRMGVIHAFEADQRGFFNIPINQAWVIQQLFAIASGDKRLYKVAERNRGGLVTAVRRLGVLHTSELRIDASTLRQKDEASLAQTWKAWKDREARIRLGWFVFVYDQLFSLYLDLSPMLLHTEITSQFPTDEALWSAPTAQEWSTRYVAKASTSAPPQKRAFLNTLRRLLHPGRFSGPPLRLNRLEAYILSITLYRIRWDSSKRSVLWEDDASLGDDVREGVTTGDGDDEGDDDDSAAAAADHGGTNAMRNSIPPVGRGSLDEAASNALRGFAEAAAATTSRMKRRRPHDGSHLRLPDPVALALSVDVQLTRLLSDLHFTGPPAFFDKLKDAAGRSGLSSALGQGAGKWLKTWMRRPANAQAKRTLLLTSANVWDLVRTSLDAAASKPDALAAQSHICIAAVFYAALTMWAYVKFGTAATASQASSSSSSSSLSSPSPPSATSSLSSGSPLRPRLTAREVAELQGMPFLDLIEASSGDSDAWPYATDPAVHERFVAAWVCGAYESAEDRTVRSWDAAAVTVRIDGIGKLPGATSPSSADGADGIDGEAGVMDVNGTSVTPSQILVSFAGLLKSVHWGQAASFRTILLHMARQESR